MHFVRFTHCAGRVFTAPLGKALYALMRYLPLIFLLVAPSISIADSNWVKYLDCPKIEFFVEPETVQLTVKDPKKFKGKACVFLSGNEQACIQIVTGEKTIIHESDMQEVIVDLFNPGKRECRYGI